MPEGDTIFKAACAMNKALARKVLTRLESVLPKLTRVNEDAPLTGQTVLSMGSRGKWSVMRFSDLCLLTHMLMNGTLASLSILGTLADAPTPDAYRY